MDLSKLRAVPTYEAFTMGDYMRAQQEDQALNSMLYASKFGSMHQYYEANGGYDAAVDDDITSASTIQNGGQAMEDARAANMSFFTKAGRGLTRFAGQTLVHTAGGIAGTLWGLGTLFTEKGRQQGFSSLWNNDLTKAADKALDYVNENNKFYYSKEEKDAGILSTMFNSKFLFDTIGGAASFVAAALLTEMITFGAGTAAIATAAPKVARMLKIGQLMDETADTISATARAATGVARSKKAYDASRIIRQVGTGSMYEGGVEARGYLKEFEQQFIQQYMAQNEGRRPTEHQVNAAKAEQMGVANSVFLLNTAMTSVANAKAMANIFGPGVKKMGEEATNLKRTITKNGLTEYKAAYDAKGKMRQALEKTWAFSSAPLIEGGQELAQSVVANTALAYSTAQYSDDYRDRTGGLAMNLKDALGELGSKEALMEGIVGGILGSVPKGVFQSIKGKGRTQIEEGGAVDKTKRLTDYPLANLRDKNEEIERSRKLATSLNTLTAQKLLENKMTTEELFEHIPMTMNAATNAARQTEASQRMDAALDKGDLHEAKNAEDDMMHSFIQTRLDAGFDPTEEMDAFLDNKKPEELASFLGYVNNTMTEEEKKKAVAELPGRVQKAKEKFKNRVAAVKKHTKVMDQVFSNVDDSEKSKELRDFMIYTASMGHSLDTRGQELMDKGNELLGGIAITEVQSKSLHDLFDEFHKDGGVFAKQEELNKFIDELLDDSKKKEPSDHKGKDTSAVDQIFNPVEERIAIKKDIYAKAIAHRRAKTAKELQEKVKLLQEKSNNPMLEEATKKIASHVESAEGFLKELDLLEKELATLEIDDANLKQSVVDKFLEDTKVKEKLADLSLQYSKETLADVLADPETKAVFEKELREAALNKATQTLASYDLDTTNEDVALLHELLSKREKDPKELSDALIKQTDDYNRRVAELKAELATASQKEKFITLDLEKSTERLNKIFEDLTKAEMLLGEMKHRDPSVFFEAKQIFTDYYKIAARRQQFIDIYNKAISANRHDYLKSIKSKLDAQKRTLLEDTEKEIKEIEKKGEAKTYFTAASLEKFGQENQGKKFGFTTEAGDEAAIIEQTGAGYVIRTNNKTYALDSKNITKLFSFTKQSVLIEFQKQLERNHAINQRFNEVYTNNSVHSITSYLVELLNSNSIPPHAAAVAIKKLKEAGLIEDSTKKNPDELIGGETIDAKPKNIYDYFIVLKDVADYLDFALFKGSNDTHRLKVMLSEAVGEIDPSKITLVLVNAETAMEDAMSRFQNPGVVLPNYRDFETVLQALKNEEIIIENLHEADDHYVFETRGKFSARYKVPKNNVNRSVLADFMKTEYTLQERRYKEVRHLKEAKFGEILTPKDFNTKSKFDELNKSAKYALQFILEAVKDQVAFHLSPAQQTKAKVEKLTTSDIKKMEIVGNGPGYVSLKVEVGIGSYSETKNGRVVHGPPQVIEVFIDIPSLLLSKRDYVKDRFRVFESVPGNAFNPRTVLVGEYGLVIQKMMKDFVLAFPTNQPSNIVELYIAEFNKKVIDFLTEKGLDTEAEIFDNFFTEIIEPASIIFNPRLLIFQASEILHSFLEEVNKPVVAQRKKEEEEAEAARKLAEEEAAKKKAAQDELDRLTKLQKEQEEKIRKAREKADQDIKDAAEAERARAEAAKKAQEKPAENPTEKPAEETTEEDADEFTAEDEESEDEGFEDEESDEDAALNAAAMEDPDDLSIFFEDKSKDAPAHKHNSGKQEKRQWTEGTIRKWNTRVLQIPGEHVNATITEVEQLALSNYYGGDDFTKENKTLRVVPTKVTVAGIHMLLDPSVDAFTKMQYLDDMAFSFIGDSNGVDILFKMANFDYAGFTTSIPVPPNKTAEEHQAYLRDTFLNQQAQMFAFKMSIIQEIAKHLPTDKATGLIQGDSALVEEIIKKLELTTSLDSVILGYFEKTAKYNALADIVREDTAIEEDFQLVVETENKAGKFQTAGKVRLRVKVPIAGAVKETAEISFDPIFNIAKSDDLNMIDQMFTQDGLPLAIARMDADPAYAEKVALAASIMLLTGSPGNPKGNDLDGLFYANYKNNFLKVRNDAKTMARIRRDLANADPSLFNYGVLKAGDKSPLLELFAYALNKAGFTPSMFNTINKTTKQPTDFKDDSWENVKIEDVVGALFNFGHGEDMGLLNVARTNGEVNTFSFRILRTPDDTTPRYTPRLGVNASARHRLDLLFSLSDSVIATHPLFKKFLGDSLTELRAKVHEMGELIDQYNANPDNLELLGRVRELQAELVSKTSAAMVKAIIFNNSKSFQVSSKLLKNKNYHDRLLKKVKARIKPRKERRFPESYTVYNAPKIKGDLNSNGRQVLSGQEEITYEDITRLAGPVAEGVSTQQPPATVLETAPKSEKEKTEATSTKPPIEQQTSLANRIANKKDSRKNKISAEEGSGKNVIPKADPEADSKKNVIPKADTEDSSNFGDGLPTDPASKTKSEQLQKPKPVGLDAIDPNAELFFTHLVQNTKTSNYEKETTRLNKVLPFVARGLSFDSDTYVTISPTKTIINFAANGLAEGTAYHEAFHVVSHALLTAKERVALYEEAASQVKVDELRRRFKILNPNRDIDTLTDSQVYEEFLAEEYRVFALENENIKSTLKGRILDFFKKLMLRLRRFLGLSFTKRELFEAISRGDFKNFKSSDVHAGKLFYTAADMYKPFEPNEDYTYEILHGMATGLAQKLIIHNKQILIFGKKGTLEISSVLKRELEDLIQKPVDTEFTQEVKDQVEAIIEQTLALVEEEVDENGTRTVEPSLELILTSPLVREIQRVFLSKKLRLKFEADKKDTSSSAVSSSKEDVAETTETIDFVAEETPTEESSGSQLLEVLEDSDVHSLRDTFRNSFNVDAKSNIRTAIRLFIAARNKMWFKDNDPVNNPVPEVKRSSYLGLPEASSTGDIWQKLSALLANLATQDPLSENPQLAIDKALRLLSTASTYDADLKALSYELDFMYSQGDIYEKQFVAMFVRAFSLGKNNFVTSSFEKGAGEVSTKSTTSNLVVKHISTFDVGVDTLKDAWQEQWSNSFYQTGNLNIDRANEAIKKFKEIGDSLLNIKQLSRRAHVSNLFKQLTDLLKSIGIEVDTAVLLKFADDINSLESLDYRFKETNTLQKDGADLSKNDYLRYLNALDTILNSSGYGLKRLFTETAGNSLSLAQLLKGRTALTKDASQSNRKDVQNNTRVATIYDFMRNEKAVDLLSRAYLHFNTKLQESVIKGPDGNNYWLYTNPAFYHKVVERLSSDPEFIEQLTRIPGLANSHYLNYFKDNPDAAAKFKVQTFLNMTRPGESGTAYADLEMEDAFKDTLNKMLKLSGDSTVTVRGLTSADKPRGMELSGVPLVFPTKTAEINSIFLGYFVDELSGYATAYDVIFDDSVPSEELTVFYHLDAKNNRFKTIELTDGTKVKVPAGNIANFGLFESFSPYKRNENDPDNEIIDQIKAQLFYLEGPSFGKLRTDARRSLANNFQENPALKELFNTYITNLLNRIADKQLEYYRENFKSLAFVDKSVIDMFKSFISSHLNIPVTQVTKEMLEEYLSKTTAINGLIGNIEQTKIFHGTIAQYKNLVDFWKRVPAYNAPYIRLMEFESAKEDSYDPESSIPVDTKYAVRPVYRAAYGVDTKIKGLSFGNLQETLQALVDSGIIIDERAKAVASSYARVNRTDAQGYVTMKRWREIMRGSQIWTAEHDAIYEKILKQEALTKDEIKLVYGTPIKGLHTGIDYKDDQSRFVYLKYSLFPLIPSYTDFFPGLKDLREGLEASNIDEFTVLDGAKQGARHLTEWIDAEGKILPADQLKINFAGKADTLAQSNFGIQLELSYHGVDHILTGSQMIKNAFLSLELNNEYSNEKETLSGKELNDEMHKSTATLYKRGYASFQESVSDANGDITLDSLYALLIQDELGKEIPNDNLLQMLHAKVPIELIPGFSKKLEQSILAKSLKKTVKVKQLGNAFVQVANLGFSDVSMVTKDQLLSYLSGKSIPLMFKDITELQPPILKKVNGEVVYRIDTNGKKIPTIVPAQVLLPYNYVKHIPKEILEDYKTKLSTGTPESQKAARDSFLEMLPEDARRLIGYRIPNQATSSNEILEVVGILPEGMGDMIVAYADITTKTGSDYDIDKMFTVMPNLYWNKATQRVERVKFHKTPTEAFQTQKEFNESVDLMTKYIRDVSKGVEVIDESGKVKKRKISIVHYVSWEKEKGTISSFNDYVDAVENLVKGKIALPESQDTNLKRIIKAAISKKFREKYVKTFEQFNTSEDPYVFNSTRAIENRRIELWELAFGTAQSYDKVMNSIDSSWLKEQAYYIKELRGDTGNMTVIEEFTLLAQLQKKKELFNAKMGIAQVANHMTAHGVVANFEKSLEFKLVRKLLGVNTDKLNYGIHRHTTRHIEHIVTSEGKVLSVIGKFDNVQEFYAAKAKIGEVNISENITAYMNAFVDVAKDPYIDILNINTVTTPTAMLLLRMGFDPFWVNTFMAQPIIKDYVEAINKLKNITSSDTQEAINKRFGVDHRQKLSSLELPLEKMLETIKTHGNTKRSKYTAEEVKLLNTFIKIKSEATSLEDLIRITKHDVKGLGKSVNNHLMYKTIREKYGVEETDGTITYPDVLTKEDTIYATAAKLTEHDFVKDFEDVLFSLKPEVMEIKKKLAVLLNLDLTQYSAIDTLDRIDRFLLRFANSNQSGIYYMGKRDLQKYFQDSKYSIYEIINHLKTVYPNNDFLKNLSTQKTMFSASFGINKMASIKPELHRGIVLGWEQLLNDNTPIHIPFGDTQEKAILGYNYFKVSDLANVMVKMAYYQSGLSFTTNSIYEFIPASYVISEGNKKAISEGLDKIKNLSKKEVVSLYKAFILENFIDDTLVPPVELPSAEDAMLGDFGGDFSASVDENNVLTLGDDFPSVTTYYSQATGKVTVYPVFVKASMDTSKGDQFETVQETVIFELVNQSESSATYRPIPVAGNNSKGKKIYENSLDDVIKGDLYSSFSENYSEAYLKYKASLVGLEGNFQVGLRASRYDLLKKRGGSYHLDQTYVDLYNDKGMLNYKFEAPHLLVQASDLINGMIAEGYDVNSNLFGNAVKIAFTDENGDFVVGKLVNYNTAEDEATILFQGKHYTYSLEALDNAYTFLSVQNTFGLNDVEEEKRYERIFDNANSINEVSPFMKDIMGTLTRSAYSEMETFVASLQEEIGLGDSYIGLDTDLGKNHETSGYNFSTMRGNYKANKFTHLVGGIVELPTTAEDIKNLIAKLRVVLSTLEVGGTYRIPVTYKDQPNKLQEFIAQHFKKEINIVRGQGMFTLKEPIADNNNMIMVKEIDAEFNRYFTTMVSNLEVSDSKIGFYLGDTFGNAFVTAIPSDKNGPKDMMLIPLSNSGIDSAAKSNLIAKYNLKLTPDGKFAYKNINASILHDVIAKYHNQHLSIKNSKVQKAIHFAKDSAMAEMSNTYIAEVLPDDSYYPTYYSSTKAYLKVLPVVRPFSEQDTVWIFGPQPMGLKEGTDKEKLQEIEKLFESHYVPRIKEALAAGVKAFVVGKAAGVDRLFEDLMFARDTAQYDNTKIAPGTSKQRTEVYLNGAKYIKSTYGTYHRYVKVTDEPIKSYNVAPDRISTRFKMDSGKFKLTLNGRFYTDGSTRLSRVSDFKSEEEFITEQTSDNYSYEREVSKQDKTYDAAVAALFAKLNDHDLEDMVRSILEAQKQNLLLEGSIENILAEYLTATLRKTPRLLEILNSPEVREYALKKEIIPSKGFIQKLQGVLKKEGITLDKQLVKTALVKTYDNTYSLLGMAQNFGNQLDSLQRQLFGSILETFSSLPLNQLNDTATHQRLAEQFVKENPQFNGLAEKDHLIAYVKDLMGYAATLVKDKGAVEFITDDVFLYSKEFLVGGTPDLIVRTSDNKFILLDFKSTRNLAAYKQRNLESHQKQLTAYGILFQRMTNLEFAEHYVIPTAISYDATNPLKLFTLELTAPIKHEIKDSLNGMSMIKGRVTNTATAQKTTQVVVGGPITKAAGAFAFLSPKTPFAELGAASNLSKAFLSAYYHKKAKIVDDLSASRKEIVKLVLEDKMAEALKLIEDTEDFVIFDENFLYNVMLPTLRKLYKNPENAERLLKLYGRPIQLSDSELGPAFTKKQSSLYSRALTIVLDELNSRVGVNVVLQKDNRVALHNKGEIYSLTGEKELNNPLTNAPDPEFNSGTIFTAKVKNSTELLSVNNSALSEEENTHLAASLYVDWLKDSKKLVSDISRGVYGTAVAENLNNEEVAKLIEKAEYSRQITLEAIAKNIINPVVKPIAIHRNAYTTTLIQMNEQRAAEGLPELYSSHAEALIKNYKEIKEIALQEFPITNIELNPEDFGEAPC